MSATLSATQDDELGAIGSWLQYLFGTGFPAVPAQGNKVPMPTGDFAVLTPITRTRLATNEARYYDPGVPIGGTRTTRGPFQLDLQLDVYGPASPDRVEVVANTFRDTSATYWFEQNGLALQALFASEPKQLAFEDEKNQYLTRWQIDLSFQTNREVTQPQQFADQLVIQLSSVS